MLTGEKRLSGSTPLTRKRPNTSQIPEESSSDDLNTSTSSSAHLLNQLSSALTNATANVKHTQNELSDLTASHKRLKLSLHSASKRIRSQQLVIHTLKRRSRLSSTAFQSKKQQQQQKLKDESRRFSTTTSHLLSIISKYNLQGEVDPSILSVDSLPTSKSFKSPKVVDHAALSDLQKQLSFLRSSFSSLKDSAQEISSLQSHLNAITSSFSQLPSYNQMTIDIEKLRSLLSLEQSKRRAAYDKISSLMGNIRVVARVRPCLASEHDLIAVKVENGSVTVATKKKELTGVVNTIKKTFNFERAIGPEDGQSEIFGEVEPLLYSFVNGKNCCISAYGQSSSGKTYTLLGNGTTEGVVQFSIAYLFKFIEESVLENTSLTRDDFVLSLSVIEIYNEDVFDLLNDQRPIAVQTNQSGDVILTGITTHELNSVSQSMSLIAAATKHRHSSSTGLNSQSSRSHCLFIFTLNKFKLVLCDLAGSESFSKAVTSSSGEGVVREGSNINKSLSAFADVLAASRAGSGHIPYRRSKLTHILSDCIGGECKFILLITISPFSSNAMETLQTLEFGSRASITSFKNKVKR
ncbi:hypothetical protein GEMRC1_003929 [Eukaryota sp. GEM-RC1]